MNRKFPLSDNKRPALLGKIQMLVAGSTWWTLPEEAGVDHPLRAVNLKMLKESPPRLARLLGVPVVHASHAGPFEGFDSPELPDVPYKSVYLGETMNHGCVRESSRTHGFGRRCRCHHRRHRPS